MARRVYTVSACAPDALCVYFNSLSSPKLANTLSTHTRQMSKLKSPGLHTSRPHPQEVSVCGSRRKLQALAFKFIPRE